MAYNRRKKASTLPIFLIGGNVALEGAYKTKLIKRLHVMFPGIVILKNDPNYLQGVPDLVLLYYNKWGMLETKRAEKAELQPNQDYYIELFDNMSFAAFIFPENEEEVLRELQQAFQPRRKTRLSVA